ncbi:molybdopterin-dependent oxidoreductase [Smaragdicoccus niigatensis]|uniref:molybdopterin-dependent oxidoreductase n=1 Tax=Smaragdicoccus niigatensis TaxID=359359 RepID=UPI00037B1D83|nr:molybdopterin-dependent oxidoreductase [Smaragdicoccus niigatensis]
MATEHVTFCRICEPFCGLIATVENDKLKGLRADPDHPLSQGFACPKGIAYAGVQNDPDRVLHPLRRRADGEFEQVSWDVAMKDIIRRTKAIRKEHGNESISLYFGNPSALNYSHAIWVVGLADALGIRHVYSAGSQDTNSRFVASHLLYGMLTIVPTPDVENTELLVVLGANPHISHGSLFSAPRLKERMHAIVERGGRVLVIDPRHTETAQDFEWLPVVPDSDAWLLLSILNVLFSEGRADLKRLAATSTGWEKLRTLVADFRPEQTESHTGVAPETVRTLARELASKKAAVYGRLGTCQGQHATLVNFLMDAVNLVAGNLDARGGAVFGKSSIAPLEDLLARTGTATVNSWRSRIGGLPEVLKTEPAALMTAEMTEPGPGQIKAMFVSAGNPVLSTPGGPALEKALDGLDLMVAVDLYVNETNRHADYVLPSTAMYEREDFAIASQTYYIKPFLQATAAVVPPAGEARPEWQIYDEIARGLGTRPVPLKAGRFGARLAEFARVPLTPTRLLDSLIRLGPKGDLFGLRRGGLTLERLITRYPHGIVLADRQPVGRLRKVVRHRDRKVHLDHPEIRADVARLQARQDDPDYPLHLIGLRELRSENSWMHNVPSMRAARAPQAARMHPDNAAELGLVHNGMVRLVSKSGAIELPVMVTDDIKPGVVAVPHGWGHKGTGTWRRSNVEGGVNVNELMSTDPRDLEQLAGMSHLNGVRIRAERVTATEGF